MSRSSLLRWPAAHISIERLPFVLAKHNPRGRRRWRRLKIREISIKIKSQFRVPFHLLNFSTKFAIRPLQLSILFPELVKLTIFMRFARKIKRRRRDIDKKARDEEARCKRCKKWNDSFKNSQEQHSDSPHDSFCQYLRSILEIGFKKTS